MPYDDAATARLGNKWHIPTDTEVKELFDNCTAKEITLNGQPGIALVSKINNNYIFFINNGYTSGIKMYGTDRCVCWTADLYTGDVQNAICFTIYKYEGKIRVDTGWRAIRFMGLNIRPIYY